MTSIFGGYEDYEFIAEFYDTVYERIRNKDIDFFVQYSKLAAGRTLELGCGTGRILLPTAVSGCGITGIDLSPYMLAKCQAKVKEQPKCAVLGPGLGCTYQAFNGPTSDHSGVIMRNKAYFRFSIGTGSTGSGNGNRKILE
jgi:SAM-dependent methyltransferase